MHANRLPLESPHTDSEFKAFLDTLKRLGIQHMIHWGPTKEEWQGIITDAGYCITALACTTVHVGPQAFLFSNGPLEWDEREIGYGPSGLFMLSRNTETGVVTPRIFYAVDGHQDDTLTGLAAIKEEYPQFHWKEEADAANRSA